MRGRPETDPDLAELGREIPLVSPCRMGHRSQPNSYYGNLAYKPWIRTPGTR